MKTSRTQLCLALALAALPGATPALADLKTARELMRENEPAQAAVALQSALAGKPGDPWLVYDSGVAAYAAKDFAKANDIWEQLAGTALPEALREHVWTQIGNVSFRLVEDSIAKEPDAALSGLEQSREAYRVALSQNKRNKVAAQNLVIVERELEKIYSLLAHRLVDEAKKEPQIQKAIDKFQAALEHQQNANALAPKDAAHEQALQEIEKQLAQKFTEKAEKTEQQADKANSNDQWQRKQAQEQLETALADFRQAQTYDPRHEPARQGEKRVQEKLANLLAKEGQREQREAENQENNNPENALDHFDAALQNFQQALALNPEHAEAQKGEQQVKAEMEKIHLAEGDRDQKNGEAQAGNNPEQAAGKMLGALEHFEEARDLDPQNKAIQDRIDRVEAELPPMLMAMGKQEQHDAAQAEPKSPGNAVAHLERAETALDKAEQLAPTNQEAQQMQQQVQSDLARLRKQLADEAEKQQQQQAQNPQPQNQQSFEAMMAQVKALQDQREVNMRHTPPRKYDPTATSPFRNW